MRLSACKFFLPVHKFQLTHPTRGATAASFSITAYSLKFQLTHPTRGATQSWGDLKTDTEISTHTPHTGCDKVLSEMDMNASSFQLTHPTRGATYQD